MFEGWSSVIKSHYPEIRGDQKTAARTIKLLKAASHFVHLSRNPWDNIASRFHGNTVRGNPTLSDVYVQVCGRDCVQPL